MYRILYMFILNIRIENKECWRVRRGIDGGWGRRVGGFCD